MLHVHLDLETFCQEPIRNGLDRYTAHPSNEILVAGLYIPSEGPPRTWDRSQPSWYAPGPYRIPTELADILLAPETQIHSYNAPFERMELIRAGGLPAELLPWSKFRCTMVEVYGLAFTGRLAEVEDQLGVPEDARKLKIGQSLIQRFCVPNPKTYKLRRYDWTTHPAEWEQFVEYCAQDTISEYQLHAFASLYEPLDEREWYRWQLAQIINETGVPVDSQIVQGALQIAETEREILIGRLKILTELDNPNSHQQFMGWCKDHVLVINNLQEETLTRTVKELKTDPCIEDPFSEIHTVIEALDLYQKASKTSVSKWKSFANVMGEGNRARFTLQFRGASRTGREAGRNIQTHNMARNSEKDLPTAEVVASGDHTALAAVEPDVVSALSRTVRCAITAPENKVLRVADLGSIESVVIAWLTDCKAMLQVFYEGRDTYRAFGSAYYGKPETEITKAERTFCKPPVLGCGYYLGAKGLVAYAEGMGVTLNMEQAVELVELFRTMYPEITDAWRTLHDTFMEVTVHGVTRTVLNGKITIWRDQNFLMCQLPSGRRLFYYRPEVHEVKMPWKDQNGNEVYRFGFTYMGKNQHTQKWERISTHGGKIIENLVQAIARDVLWLGIEYAFHYGYTVVLDVHDELLTEQDIDDQYHSLQGLIWCMTQKEPWMEGMPLTASGIETKRYYKD